MALIKTLLLLIIGTVIFFLGLEFTLQNKQPITLQLGNMQLPEFSLGLWVLIAFTLGGLLGLLLSLFITLRLKARCIKYKHDLKHCQDKLNDAQGKAVKDTQ